MQKIVGGKRYDTEKATRVAAWKTDLALSDADYCSEELYLTPKGNWFLVGEGGPRTKYASHGQRIGRDLIPLTCLEAQGWLERHNHMEEMEKHFAGEIEDA